MSKLKDLNLKELKEYNRRKNKQASILYQEYKAECNSHRSEYTQTLKSMAGLDDLLKDTNHKLLYFYK